MASGPPNRVADQLRDTAATVLRCARAPSARRAAMPFEARGGSSAAFACQAAHSSTADTERISSRRRLQHFTVRRASPVCRMATAENPSSCSSPGECAGLFQAKALNKRIGVPVHELPFGSLTAENLSDPQRPVLLGQVADLRLYPLDRYKNDKITRVVRRHN